MRIDVRCPFCVKEFSIDPGTLRAPARDALKFNCPRCNSRIALDLKIRRASKSRALRQAEDKYKHDMRLAGSQFYNRTPQSVAVPWEKLGKYDQQRWMRVAVDEGAVAKPELLRAP